MSLIQKGMDKRTPIWTLAKTLLTCLVGAAAIMAFAGIVGSERLSSLKGQAENMLQLTNSVKDLVRLRMLTLEQINSAKDFLLTNDYKHVTVFEKARHDFEDKIAQLREAAKKDGNGEKLTELETIKARNDEYVEIFRRVTALRASGKLDEAKNTLTNDADRKAEEILGAIQSLSAKVDQAAEETGTNAIDSAKWAAEFVPSLVLFSIAAFFLAGVLFSRGNGRSVKRLEHIRELAERVTQGDLTHVFKQVSYDEIGYLAAAIGVMQESLDTVIGEVRLASTALSAAGAQVSSTAQNLSSGTSELAASVEEITSSLQEMGASIAQNADNSSRMRQMALKGVQDAEEAGSAVKDTVQAMKAITERISIIEEIAYQTNLLSLNATIEAAQAGEHGKGFAVVATEVRKLAERSQTAAKEIEEVATSSVNVAERSGQLLVELVPSIQKTAILVQEVALASSEQSSGIAQVNRTMSQVDQVTQRNASVAEELSSTAEEMSSQAGSLSRLMEFFKVSASDKSGGPRHSLASVASSHAAAAILDKVRAM